MNKKSEHAPLSIVDFWGEDKLGVGASLDSHTKIQKRLSEEIKLGLKNASHTIEAHWKGLGFDKKEVVAFFVRGALRANRFDWVELILNRVQKESNGSDVLAAVVNGVLLYQVYPDLLGGVYGGRSNSAASFLLSGSGKIRELFKNMNKDQGALNLFDVSPYEIFLMEKQKIIRKKSMSEMTTSERSAAAFGVGLKLLSYLDEGSLCLLNDDNDFIFCGVSKEKEFFNAALAAKKLNFDHLVSLSPNQFGEKTRSWVAEIIRNELKSDAQKSPVAPKPSSKHRI